MNQPSIRREELPGGGLLLTERVPGVRSVALGVWVRTGSRDEPARVQGISHFLEHMMFKGTVRRTAQDIARSLDAVGGVLDAYTTREYTCYFARVLDEHVELAFDVIGDCLSHSLFDPSQVEREKQVIQEEILSYEDTPEDLAGDTVAELVWRDHPLGTPILGTRESVRSFTSGLLHQRFQETYGAQAAVVGAAGAVDHQRIRNLALAHLDLPATAPPARPVAAPPRQPPATAAIERDLSQLNICLGAPGLAYGDPRRHALELMNAVLGGSMSSRIFQRVREEEGLAYSVFTDHEAYLDGGLFTCSLGVSPGSEKRALALIGAEFADLCRRGLRPGELEAMQSQWAGNLLMGLESTTERLRRLVRTQMLFGRYVPVEEDLDRIARVAEADVIDVARAILRPDGFSMVTVGPLAAGALGPGDLGAGGGSGGSRGSGSR